MNVLGGVYVTQALLPAMVEHKGGKVVFISSQAGQVSDMTGAVAGNARCLFAS